MFVEDQEVYFLNRKHDEMIVVCQDGSADQLVFTVLALRLFRCLFLASRQVSHSPFNLKTHTPLYFYLCEDPEETTQLLTITSPLK